MVNARDMQPKRILSSTTVFATALMLLAAGCTDLADSGVDCDAPVQLGENAIHNGGAEADEGTDGAVTEVSCWEHQEGCFTVMDYEEGYGGFQNAPPPNAGLSLFSGGASCDAGNSNSVGTQTLDSELDNIADDIATGELTYDFSADLGGWEGQNDSATITAAFLDASGSELHVATLGPISSDDRNGETGFLQRSASGDVPADTESIEITFASNKTGGSNNDGVADNISLVLNR